MNKGAQPLITIYTCVYNMADKAKDEDGKEKYNRTRIYQWIDNLREMRINLSFTETSNQKNNW